MVCLELSEYVCHIRQGKNKMLLVEWFIPVRTVVKGEGLRKTLFERVVIVCVRVRVRVRGRVCVCAG